MPERKIILNIAMSLDGYIADPSGVFDWIKGDGNKSTDSDEQFGFEDFLKEVDTIVMGGKAYDDALVDSLENYKGMKILVATASPLHHHHE